MDDDSDLIDAPPVDTNSRRAILASMMSGNTAAPMPVSHAVAAPSAPPVETGVPSGLPSSAPSLTAPPVQPNRAQAQVNTIGKQPNQKDYQPIITHPLLKRIGIGLATFGLGNQAGEEAYNNAFVNPVKHAHQAYEDDTAAYNERLKGMNEQTAQDREESLNAANINHLNAETAGLANGKQGLTPEETTIHDLMTGDNGHPRINPQTGNPYSYLDAFSAVKQAGQDVKPDKPGSDFDQYYKDYIAANKLPDTPQNRLTARQQYAAAGQAPQHDPRQLAVGPDGKVIELKPGVTVPQGTQSVSGDLRPEDPKAKQADESRKAAQKYADDYLKSGRYTGAGDEALMEKYFELAKPSSGFRMTQPQIEMLTKAQDIMNSVVAKGKHLFSPEAPYFSTDLRNQIVETMGNLQKATDEVKQETQSKKTSTSTKSSSTGKSSTPQRPKGVPEDATWNPDSRHWEK